MFLYIGNCGSAFCCTSKYSERILLQFGSCNCATTGWISVPCALGMPANGSDKPLAEPRLVQRGLDKLASCCASFFQSPVQSWLTARPSSEVHLCLLALVPVSGASTLSSGFVSVPGMLAQDTGLQGYRVSGL